MSSWGAACVGKKFATTQPPATQHSPFSLCSSSSSHWGILWLSCPNWELFCSLMAITRIWPQASLLFLWKGFLIHHYPCEETTILGPCLSYIKTHVLLPCLSLTHKHSSSTGVRGNVFFSLSREGCYVWSVQGKCGRTKVAGKGHSACRRISSLSRGKERGKLWYSWLCRSIYTAESNALVFSFINNLLIVTSKA